MRQLTTLTCTIGQTSEFRSQATRVVEYLGTNPTLTILEEEIVRDVMRRAISTIKTPMTILFTHIFDYYKISKYPLVPVYLYNTTGNIPELLTTDSVVIDCREVLRNEHPILNNTIVNFSNVMDVKDHTNVKVQDLSVIQNLYVRAALCSNYNATDTSQWLTPKMGTFIMRSFNAVLTTLLRTTFNLTDPTVMKRLAIVIHAYMAQKLEKEPTTSAPELLYRANIATQSEITEVYSMLGDQDMKFDHQVFLPEFCEMLKVVVGDRFDQLDIGRLFKLFSRGSRDIVSGAIALEYPPYWVYTLLYIASGGKHPIYNNIFRSSGIKREISVFADDLNRYSEFVPSLGR